MVATNRLFTQYTHERQQALVERLIMSAIKQYGVDVKYIPRELVALDPIFGEDPASRFSTAIDIEVYPESVEGFEGNPAMASKFGDFMKDEIKFTMSKKRFEEVRTGNMMTESGWPLVVESTNTYEHGSTDGLILFEDGSIPPLNVDQIRPNEGDLIWFPMVGRLFEIKFVNMEKFFYQLGKLNVYHLTCEIMDYSSEPIATGVGEIDAVETEFTHNVLGNGYLAEDGIILLMEDGMEYLIDDSATISPNDAFADNEPFEREGNTFLDFSEKNPFSEPGNSLTSGPLVRSNIDITGTPGDGSTIVVDQEDYLVIE